MNYKEQSGSNPNAGIDEDRDAETQDAKSLLLRLEDVEFDILIVFQKAESGMTLSSVAIQQLADSLSKIDELITKWAYAARFEGKIGRSGILSKVLEIGARLAAYQNKFKKLTRASRGKPDELEEAKHVVDEPVEATSKEEGKQEMKDVDDKEPLSAEETLNFLLEDLRKQAGRLRDMSSDSLSIQTEQQRRGLFHRSKNILLSISNFEQEVNDAYFNSHIESVQQIEFISQAGEIRALVEEVVKFISDKEFENTKHFNESFDGGFLWFLKKLENIDDFSVISYPVTIGTEQFFSATAVLKKYIELERLAKIEQENLTEDTEDKKRYIEVIFDSGARLKQKLLDQEAADFSNKSQIQDLLTAIDNIPRTSADLGISQIADQLPELNNLRTFLVQANDGARQAGLLKHTLNSAMNQKIDEVISRYEEAIARVDNMIKEAKEPVVPNMSLEEIVDELISKGFDPFRSEELSKEVHITRNIELASVFNERKNEVLLDQQQDLARITQKVRAQLYFLDNALSGLTGQATVDRSRVIDAMQGRFQMSRKELIKATTEHPVFGADIVEMVDCIRNTASVPKGHMLVRRNLVMSNGETLFWPKRKRLSQDVRLVREMTVLIKENQFDSNDDEEVFRHIPIGYNPQDPPPISVQPAITYDDLAVEGGREKLTEFLHQRFASKNKLAIEFANLLFNATGEISTVLARLQRRTKTQQHTDNAEVDPVLLLDPLAAAEHRAERNGGNPKDWVLWWLACLEKIPISDTLGKILGSDEERSAAIALARFRNNSAPALEATKSEWEDWYDHDSFGCKLKKNWAEEVKKAIEEGFFENTDLTESLVGRLYPSQTLREKQEEVWMYLSCFFDIDNFAGKIPLLGFDETYFSPLYNLAVLGDTESLGSRGQVEPITNFQTAEKTWGEILEMIFKNVGSKLSTNVIFEQAVVGQKGGLVGKWLSLWSALKIFPGKQMELFEPLTIFFFYQIAQSYKGRGSEALRDLHTNFIQALTDSQQSGGLELISSQIENVKKAITSSDGRSYSQNLAPHAHSVRSRDLHRQEYVHHLYVQKSGKKIPRIYTSNTFFTLKSVFVTLGPRDTYFHDMLNYRKALERPLGRSGSLIASKEAESQTR